MTRGTGDRTIVIGGGIIGALCAWYLSQSGWPVTVVDRDRFGAGCSHGNCGYLCPSHVLPLPAPGAIARTLGAMLHRDSAFSIRPRLSPGLWRWLWRFAGRCNRRDMISAARARHALLTSSMQLYRELLDSEEIDCEWESQGLLFVYFSRREFEAYESTDRLLRETFGVAATPYDGGKLVELEPALRPGLGGAWHYEDDCHLRPDRLMTELRRRLESRGVDFVEGRDVKGFVRKRDRAVAVTTTGEPLEGSRFVVATGALTPFLNRHLGCRIPIQPGKGYSITMPRPVRCPRIPMIFEEHRVAVTPMRSGYRLGSMMEFAGYDTTIRPERLELLRAGARHYLHEPFRDPVEEEWYGWRPMTWDGKPIIDRSPAMENVWIAAGHNMLGLSMAPATGKLIAELALDRTPHIDPAPFSVSRF